MNLDHAELRGDNEDFNLLAYVSRAECIVFSIMWWNTWDIIKWS
jgi:hypothetical protein